MIRLPSNGLKAIAGESDRFFVSKFAAGKSHDVEDQDHVGEDQKCGHGAPAIAIPTNADRMAVNMPNTLNLSSCC